MAGYIGPLESQVESYQLTELGATANTFNRPYTNHTYTLIKKYNRWLTAIVLVVINRGFSTERDSKERLYSAFPGSYVRLRPFKQTCWVYIHRENRQFRTFPKNPHKICIT
jgi:hypothetical protein